MPTFVVPSSFGTLREFNPCHHPAGTPNQSGGQFCSMPGAWASSRSKITKSRPATTGPMRPATDAERRRYAIPPAYKDAKVATDPKAELKATAVTPAGKTAYYYSAAYEARQQAAKWSRVVAFQKDAPALHERLAKDIAKGGEDRHTAMTLRLIMQTGMRNGIEADGSFGATSLRLEHVTVSGDTVRFQFPGKGGKAQDVDVKDPVIARYVEERRKTGAEKLFPHEADDTLRYLKSISRGKDYKVHDLRTWYGTVYGDYLTQTMLKQGHKPTTKKEHKAFRKEVATKVSERLGNTPAIALKTYIHPLVFAELDE